MSLLPPTLNGLRIMSARLSFPWRGVWFADVELDLEDVLLIPAGPAILLIGGASLRCTVDPRGSGTFGPRARVRVVGGSGGWDKPVPAQHFANPAGILPSALVYAATAGAVGELPPIDLQPVNFGAAYVRSAGVASRVFGDRDWYVEPVTGIATVAAWLPLPLDPDATIVDYDIGQKRVAINSETLIFPGTQIIDSRFNGAILTARDVEQTFDASGLHADVWVADAPVSRLQEAFAGAVREFAGTAYLKTYRYRYVLPVGGSLALQAITPGAPDLNPITQWTGISGITASLAGNAALTPATELVVGFVGGNPAEPFLVAFAPLNKPLGLSLDATTFVNVGLATSPVALSVGALATISALQIEVAALGAYVAALTAAFAANPAVYAPTAAAMVAPGAAAATAMAVGATAVAAGQATIPSRKLFSE